MVIEGKKNLKLVKESLLSYMVACLVAIKRSPNKEVAATFERKLDSVNELLGAVETNLSWLKAQEIN